MQYSQKSFNRLQRDKQSELSSCNEIWGVTITFFSSNTSLLPTGFEKAEEKISPREPYTIQNLQTLAIECKNHHKSISLAKSNLDIKNFEVFKDNMKNFRSAKSGKPLAPKQDKDKFRSALDLPFLNEESFLFNSDSYNAQYGDNVLIPDLANKSKKRRYINSIKANELRKVSRNIVESHLPSVNWCKRGNHIVLSKWQPFLNLDNKKSKARRVAGSVYRQTNKYDKTN